MTPKEVKAELSCARSAALAYRLARDEAQAFREQLYGGKGISYDKDTPSGSRSNNVENALCRLADYEAERDELLNQMNSAYSDTELLIGTVEEPVLCEILTRRYIMQQRWEDIAEAMSYSRQHITRLHGRALQMLSESRA